jgi:predicted metal-binding membrane protein
LVLIALPRSLLRCTAGFGDAAAGSGNAVGDSFTLAADRDGRSSGSFTTAAAAAAGGSELQSAVAGAAMQLVLERGAAAAAAAMLRALLHTADLVTVAAGKPNCYMHLFGPSSFLVWKVDTLLFAALKVLCMLESSSKSLLRWHSMLYQGTDVIRRCKQYSGNAAALLHTTIPNTAVAGAAICMCYSANYWPVHLPMHD